jgi:hypothetical protein
VPYTVSAASISGTAVQVCLDQRSWVKAVTDCRPILGFRQGQGVHTEKESQLASLMAAGVEEADLVVVWKPEAQLSDRILGASS